MSRDLRQYFLSILGKKDYSEKELLNKGLKKGFLEGEVQEEIGFLVEKKFVSDDRLAENIIHYYQGLKGKRWLEQKMRQRGLRPTNIQNALAGFEEFASGELKKQVENKYKIESWQDLDMKTKQKIVNFLSYRGFSDSFGIIDNWGKTAD